MSSDRVQVEQLMNETLQEQRIGVGLRKSVRQKRSLEGQLVNNRA